MASAECVEEFMDVPAGEVHQLSGKGGSTIRTVEMRSGAKLFVLREPSGTRLKLRGLEAQVSKAKRMLNAMLDFNVERTAEEETICKSFASGFCRFGGERCQDGASSSERARKAEEAWLQGGAVAGDPLGGEEPELGKPLLLAIGCELSGAHRFNGEGEDEIAEMAVIAICPRSKREVGRFHRWVKPHYWIQEEEALKGRFAADCFNSSSSAVGFTDALADILDWLPGVLGATIDDLSPEDFMFVGWRDHEVQVLLPKQCNTPPGAVDEQLQNVFFSRWVSLKDVFISHFSMSIEIAPQNSALMMKHLGLSHAYDPMQRNLATQSASSTGRILQELLRNGWEAKATAWRETVSGPANFLLPSRAGEGQRMLLAKRTWAQANGQLEDKMGLPQAQQQSQQAPYAPMLPPPPPTGTGKDMQATSKGKGQKLGGISAPGKGPPAGVFAKGVPSAPWRRPPVVSEAVMAD